MTQRLLHFSFAMLVALFLLSSCAKETTRNDKDTERELLDAYIKVTYGDNPPQKSGLGYYYQILKQGGQTTKAVDGNWVKFDYIAQSTNGTYDFSAVTMADFAKEHGIFSERVHYVPNYQPVGVNYGAIAAGLQDALKTFVAEGDSVRLIMQPSLAPPTQFTGNVDPFLPVIIDFALRKVVVDPQKYEYQEIQDFREKHYPELSANDSARYYLYVKEIAPPTADVTPKEGDTVKVFYVGRYLDGFVFDSNIADTLKKYGFTNDKIKAADTMKFVIGDIAEKDGAKGFEEALKYMKQGSAAVAFFASSPWGYGVNGKDNTIKPYSPLQFEVKLLYVGKKEGAEK